MSEGGNDESQDIPISSSSSTSETSDIKSEPNIVIPNVAPPEQDVNPDSSSTTVQMSPISSRARRPPKPGSSIPVRSKCCFLI